MSLTSRTSRTSGLDDFNDDEKQYVVRYILTTIAMLENNLIERFLLVYMLEIVDDKLKSNSRYNIHEVQSGSNFKKLSCFLLIPFLTLPNIMSVYSEVVNKKIDKNDDSNSKLISDMFLRVTEYSRKVNSELTIGELTDVFNLFQLGLVDVELTNKLQQFRDNINIDKEFRDKLENCLQSNKKKIELGLSCLQLSSPTSKLELLNELNDNLGMYNYTDSVKYSIGSVFVLKCLKTFGEEIIRTRRSTHKNIQGFDYELVCCDINICENWFFYYLLYNKHTVLLPNFDVLSPDERQFYITNFRYIAHKFYNFITGWLIEADIKEIKNIVDIKKLDYVDRNILTNLATLIQYMSFNDFFYGFKITIPPPILENGKF